MHEYANKVFLVVTGHVKQEQGWLLLFRNLKHYQCHFFFVINSVLNCNALIETRFFCHPMLCYKSNYTLAINFVNWKTCRSLHFRDIKLVFKLGNLISGISFSEKYPPLKEFIGIFVR